MKAGLFFGSFNPIHTGHLIVAQQMLEAASLDKIWFVLSPQNPFKSPAELADENSRLSWVEKAISGNPAFEVCKTELEMPRPSYTIDTLEKLRGIYPSTEFSIILGSDNLASFDKWKSYQTLCAEFDIHIYLRGAVDEKWTSFSRMRIYDLPFLHISATYIRQKARKGEDIRYLVPDSILKDVKAAFSFSHD
jgi:nicotinate-nucleotide adenylyltransferase